MQQQQQYQQYQQYQNIPNFLNTQAVNNNIDLNDKIIIKWLIGYIMFHASYNLTKAKSIDYFNVQELDNLKFQVKLGQSNNGIYNGICVVDHTYQVILGKSNQNNYYKQGSYIVNLSKSDDFIELEIQGFPILKVNPNLYEFDNQLVYDQIQNIRDQCCLKYGITEDLDRDYIPCEFNKTYIKKTHNIYKTNLKSEQQKSNFRSSVGYAVESYLYYLLGYDSLITGDDKRYLKGLNVQDVLDTLIQSPYMIAIVKLLGGLYSNTNLGQKCVSFQIFIRLDLILQVKKVSLNSKTPDFIYQIEEYSAFNIQHTQKNCINYIVADITTGTPNLKHLMKTKEYEAIFRNLMITKHPKAFKDGKYLNISSFDLNVLPMPYYNYLQEIQINERSYAQINEFFYREDLLTLIYYAQSNILQPVKVINQLAYNTEKYIPQETNIIAQILSKIIRMDLSFLQLYLEQIRMEQIDILNKGQLETITQLNNRQPRDVNHILYRLFFKRFQIRDNDITLLELAFNRLYHADKDNNKNQLTFKKLISKMIETNNTNMQLEKNHITELLPTKQLQLENIFFDTKQGWVINPIFNHKIIESISDKIKNIIY